MKYQGLFCIKMKEKIKKTCHLLQLYLVVLRLSQKLERLEISMGIAYHSIQKDKQMDTQSKNVYTINKRR